MEDKRYDLLAQAKNIFEDLKTDDSRVLFTEDKINDRLFVKLKKLYKRQRACSSGNIDRSTLYNIDGPFQLIHADVGNLEFLGKSATHPEYCLLMVDIFTWKIYTYPMRSRRLRAKKLQEFSKKETARRCGFRSIKSFNKTKSNN